MAETKLAVGDFVTIALYFAAVLAAGLYSMCRTNRSTVNGYFLAGRFMTWLPIGASLFASNIGSEHFIGLAGSGAAAGVAVGSFELNACIILQLLGWVFLPVYIASGVCTLPEYISVRFGGKRIRIYLATLSVVLYVFTKISVNLYSGALFIQQAVQMNLYVSVLLLLLVTAITTVTGGLAAVIYTDTLQAFVMIIGASILTIISFVKVGGYEGLYTRYIHAIPNTTLASNNTSCGYPREDSWYMLRNPIDSDLPWPGFLVGQSLASIWYWCADQMMVQRTLAARSLSHAQGATLFAGYLKLLPHFLIVIPGMISRVLFTDRVACVDPDVCESVCQSRVSCTNIAYPTLVLELLPDGLRGLLLAVMLAALMSDMSSIFNSASTLFTMDLYINVRRQASNRELMIVGRLFACLMVVASIAWIPVVQVMQGGQLYHYIQAIAAYLSPPIATVYLLAVLWPAANEQGAFWGLIAGTLVGAIRMVLDFALPEPTCGEVDTRPAIIARVHYMYFAVILGVITSTVTVIVSKLTSSQHTQVAGLTFWSRHQQCARTTVVQAQSANYEQEITTPRSDNQNGVVKLELTPTDGENVLATGPEEVVRVKEASRCTVGYVCRWFCGLESDQSQVAQEESHVHRLQSLEQTPQQRYALLAALAGVLIAVLLLYIFFSTGSHF